MIFKTRSVKSAAGDKAEQDAKSFLVSEGLSFLEQNYRCKLGEIDLIMQDAKTIVFVEVRMRRSDSFGGAAASVSAAKQQKITNTAKHYLVSKHLYERSPVRFDVIASSGNDINWIKGAF